MKAPAHLALLLPLLLTACATTKPVPAYQPFDEAAIGEELIRNARAASRQDHKRVLLVFGANWCSDSRSTMALFTTNGPVASAIAGSYVVTAIDVGPRGGQPRKNQPLIDQYGAAVETGIPVLVVLDEQGRPLNDTKKERLADSDHKHPEKIEAFLKQWAW